MKASIIVIGNEIILGKTFDTNSGFLAKGMAELGIDLIRILKIGDEPDLIKETVNYCLNDSDLIITSGGLGPTKDDITKKAVADYLNLEIVVDEKLLENVKEKFRKFGYKKMPGVNISQAEIPKGAVIFPNDRGTASGLLVFKDRKMIIMLPGVPGEFEHLFNKQIKSYFKDILPERSFIISKTVRTSGIGESRLAEVIEPVLEDLIGIETAYLPSIGNVDIRFTGKNISPEEMEIQFEQIKKSIMPLIGKFVYGFDEEDQAENLGKQLKNLGYMIATAESCTGGLIAKMFTDVSGSSSFFERGLVTYSNESKIEHLGVRKKTLEKYGAVSKETAEEMAEGLKKVSRAKINVSITGIAGPTGGTKEKPVGTVFIGLSDDFGTIVKQHKFAGQRDQIRRRSALAVLNLVRGRLNDKKFYSN